MNETASRLASALRHRNQQPNIDLALDLAQREDIAGVAELAALLTSGAKPLRHDAITTLYEVGAQKPDLITPHIEVFLQLLSSRDNRMIWGTLYALDAICVTVPKVMMANLDAILDAADRSSVIAKDKTMSILARLNSLEKFSPVVAPVILQRLRNAAVNQFPMYAELTAATIASQDKAALVKILKTRREAISYPAKKNRIDKLLHKLENT